jgi:hypothetical protein
MGCGSTRKRWSPHQPLRQHDLTYTGIVVTDGRSHLFPDFHNSLSMPDTAEGACLSTALSDRDFILSLKGRLDCTECRRPRAIASPRRDAKQQYQGRARSAPAGRPRQGGGTIVGPQNKDCGAWMASRSSQGNGASPIAACSAKRTRIPGQNT